MEADTRFNIQQWYIFPGAVNNARNGFSEQTIEDAAIRR